jgi:serine/threonine-protein kinase
VTPHADAHRDLLFGLLALQHGVISRDQLVAAFAVSTAARGRPMADVLADQGALAAPQRAPLEALVAAHCDLHGDDPAASLAAVAVSPSTRESLANAGGPTAEATLRYVGTPAPAAAPDAHPDPASDADPSMSTDADRTASWAAGAATAGGQRFRVLRPHRRGGLGAVFVALDAELNREVALKRILDDRADDPDSRLRFLLEAEITGGLEHPGVVPVYGLGASGDGRPYYAMRFIKGDSLKDAIARFHDDATLKADPGRWSLELRKLLRRFLDVCNALEYAHSRGVVHRDVKPENIIVGDYGETLVVDWGLAKAVGRDDPPENATETTLRPASAVGSAETIPGRALGTPAYMSPEQARGDLAAIGPRSDVYSLGATLYSVLTGRRAFEGSDLGAVLGAVERGEFQPPRALDPAIDPALEAVVRKAMATKPADRYGSCRALADDVEAWLADERVSAYPEPWTRTARRALARRRTLVTGVAAAGLAGLIGLGAVAAVQSQARAALAVKNNALTNANAALDRQRLRAESNEAAAIDAVKRFRDAVTENPELKNSPTLEGLRRTLLKEPLAFFRGLRERLQADLDARPQELARLAEVIHDYAHLTSEIGELSDGLKAHEESLAIWEGLVRDDPAQSEYQYSLAGVQDCRGDFLRATGKPTEALAEYLRVRATLERLARDNPAGTKFQAGLAHSYNNIGAVLSDVGKPTEALAEHERAREIFERLARDDPAVSRFQGELANSHHNIGVLLSATGQPTDALAALERARRLYERLAQDNPTVTKFQAGLANSHKSIGRLLAATGLPAEALAANERARAIWERLARDNPAVIPFQAELSSSHNHIGNLQSRTGHPTEALAAYQRARAIDERLAREHPESPVFASALGATLNNLAILDLKANRFVAARDRLREASAWQKKALAANPRNPTYRQFLVNHAGNLMSVAQGLHDADLAAEAQNALDELRASDPRIQALDARLAAVQRGEAPKDQAERLALAQRTYDLRRYVASARLWAEAMASDPSLAESRQSQHPYNAACAAALAAAGRGEDEPAPDAVSQTRLRGQALGWLRGELAAWDAVLTRGSAQDRTAVAQTLRHWQADSDLAAVRDSAPLAKLPEPERAQWQGLWAEVASRLGQAEGTAGRSPPGGELPADPFLP